MKKRICQAAGLLSASVLMMSPVLFNRNAADYPYPKTTTTYASIRACKVRNGPGVEFDLVAWLEAGQTVIVIELVENERGETWYRIEPHSLSEGEKVSADECYIRSDLLEAGADN